MTGSATFVAHLVRVDERLATADQLENPEWVASEFAAIMHSSGFGDRVIATTLMPRPTTDAPRDRGDEGSAPPRASGRAARVGERERSPPGAGVAASTSPFGSTSGEEQQMTWSDRLTATAADLADRVRDEIDRLDSGRGTGGLMAA